MVSIRRNPNEPTMFKQMALAGYRDCDLRDKSPDSIDVMNVIKKVMPLAHAFNLNTVQNIIDCAPKNLLNFFPPFPVFWIEGFKIRETKSAFVGILVLSQYKDEIYTFRCFPFSKFKGVIVGPAGMVVFHSKKDGDCITQDGTGSGAVEYKYRCFFSDSDKDGDFVVAQTSVPVMNFMSLINASNISCPQRTFEVNRQTKRRLDAKSANRYHVLKIHKPGEKIKKDSETGENEGKMPLHVVRGHLADYTENGLFGKYFGTFFIPSHVRGNKNNGTITKDYALV